MKLTKLFGQFALAVHLLLGAAMVAGLVVVLWQIHVSNQMQETDLPMVILKPQVGREKVFRTMESAMRHARTGDTVTLNPGVYEAVYQFSNQP